MSEKKVPLLKTKLNKGDKVIDLKKRVEVIATAKNPYKKKGTKSFVSPAVAAKGISMGYYEPLTAPKTAE